MDEEYVMQTANIIAQQLLTTTPKNVLFSWGAFYGFRAAIYKDMAALKFKVDGRLFQGDVIIAYNENDTYEIYLQDKSGTRLVKDDVYFDEMSEVIDVAIERGDNQKEYDAFCEGERQKIMCGDI